MSDDIPSSADLFGQIADEFCGERFGKRSALGRGVRPPLPRAGGRDPRRCLPVLMEQAKSVDDTPDQRRPARTSVCAAPLRQLGDYQILAKWVAAAWGSSTSAATLAGPACHQGAAFARHA